MVWQISAADTFLACKNQFTAWTWCWDHCFVKFLSPHVPCRVMTLNKVLSLENSQLLCNKSIQSKTSWNDIMCLVNSFLDHPICPENGVCSSKILENNYQRTWGQTSKSIIFTVTAVRTSNFAPNRLSSFQCTWTWLHSL